MRTIEKETQPPALSPFDSLLLPYISPQHRLLLAEQASKVVLANVIEGEVYRHESSLIDLPDGNDMSKLESTTVNNEIENSLLRDSNSRGTKRKSVTMKRGWGDVGHAAIRGKIKIGFMSYDFNGHPTAHLVEAIFVEISNYVQQSGRKSSTAAPVVLGSSPTVNRKHHVFDDIELYVYSYGKDDNSTYRNNLIQVWYFFSHHKLSNLSVLHTSHVYFCIAFEYLIIIYLVGC